MVGIQRLFDKTNPREKRKVTHFDDEIFITMAGKKQNIRKLIATNAEDCGIYEQIEKYGLNPISKIEISDIIEDYTQIAGDLRTTIERGQLAKEMFKNLPLEIRKEFNHDENLFMQQGEKWMQDKWNQIQKQRQEKQEQKPTQGQGE